MIDTTKHMIYKPHQYPISTLTNLRVVELLSEYASFCRRRENAPCPLQWAEVGYISHCLRDHMIIDDNIRIIKYFEAVYRIDHQKTPQQFTVLDMEITSHVFPSIRGARGSRLRQSTKLTHSSQHGYVCSIQSQNPAHKWRKFLKTFICSYKWYKLVILPDAFRDIVYEYPPTAAGCHLLAAHSPSIRNNGHTNCP